MQASPPDAAVGARHATPASPKTLPSVYGAHSEPLHLCGACPGPLAAAGLLRADSLALAWPDSVRRLVDGWLTCHPASTPVSQTVSKGAASKPGRTHGPLPLHTVAWQTCCSVF